jgi:hypothetical protein
MWVILYPFTQQDIRLQGRKVPQTSINKLKQKDKRDVCMLSSIYDDGIKTVHHKKYGLKQKPKVCTDYNDAMGGVDLSDQYLVM